MIVGFTGTSKGMTVKQNLTVAFLLASFHGGDFHHGDCVGADEEADEIAHGFDYSVVIHPPIKDTKRAFCNGAILVHEPKEYLERNHDIVDACDTLIATPQTKEEQLRSGTWATVRYARKKQKSIWIVNPDGSIIRER